MEVLMKDLILFLISGFLSLLILAGCEQKGSIGNPVSSLDQSKSNTSLDNMTSAAKLRQETLVELARVRAATAKYHDLNTAINDGYVDINVFISHMGWHYMKMDIVDGNFEVEKPELLVYAPWPNGELKLVAVEYGVPHSLSPDPPEGFTGDDDVWDLNTGADLWTLHAWVWYNNPDGIFTPYNPRVD
jgi:hypothetical protein